MSATPNRPIAVVTIHGTGDTAETPEGPKWFQQGSAFSERLTARLAALGHEAEIVPLLWSGANSTTGREKGAEKLSRLIMRLARTHAGVHLVGHSHGGNVANDAACQLNWSSKQRHPKIASLITVGTPFFKARVSRIERLVAWMFVVMLAVSVLAFAAVWIFGGAPLVDMFFYGDTPDWAATILGVLSTANIVSLAFVFPLALRGVARIRRAGRPMRRDTEVTSIWHPNDEAIAFLQRIDQLPIEPFRAGSIWRGSRTAAIVWGMNGVIAGPVLALLWTIGLVTLFLNGREWGVPLTQPQLTLGVYVAYFLLVFGLFATPLLFAFIYALNRLGAATVLEWGLRKQLNKVVGGTLKGIAFGRDGDRRIGDVSSCSHNYATRQVVLEGDVAARMIAASSEATRRLFDKYRGGLFSVGADSGNALTELTADAMTWDSLVHATYFDHPEIAEMIADRIAAVASADSVPPAMPLSAAQSARAA
ncbi:esterase/lipase family protein [Terricaulis sp.]|uniref:esterase/lipase family protein n=1 Tax=Terricaulis sp. TaxID=2768686 RepID=UPI003784586D